MGKIRDLEITYDRSSVYAGGLLTGKVCFYLKDSCKLKDLCIWAEGQTKVTLPGDSSNERWLLRNELTLVPYLMQYDYRLPQGHHQVPFAFPVPPFLPSSFGDKYGYIYYCCRATVGNGLARVHKPFTLIGVEDLNWHPYAAMPVTIKEYGCKSFWAFGRQNGNVQVLLTLERSGFVPGECIYVNAEIVNNSKKKLRSSMVQLRQGVLYKTSGGRSKETFQIVADLQHGSVQPGSIDQWEREAMSIPPVPPSFLRGSENISLKYDLIFSVPDAQVTITVPVIIGTLPYHPDNMRRVMKALPWHAEPQQPVEGIYGARPVICPPQPPAPMPMPMHCTPHQQQLRGEHTQQIYGGQNDENGGYVDENRGPSTIYTTEDEDDENNNYRNNACKNRQENGKEIYSSKSGQNNRREEIYANKKNCYYYNDDQTRFIKIEEVD